MKYLKLFRISLMVVFSLIFLTSCVGAVPAGIPTGDAPNTPTEVPVEESASEVAILIIDDFSGTALPATQEKNLPSSESCVVNVDGQQVFSSGGGTPVDCSIDTTHHGHLVYGKLREFALNSSNNFSDQDGDIPPPNEVIANTHGEIIRINGRGILLVEVDIPSFDTRSIAQTVNQNLEALMKLGINKFVINMSFSVIPSCDLYNDPQSYLGGIETFCSQNPTDSICDLFSFHNELVAQSAQTEVINYIYTQIVNWRIQQIQQQESPEESQEVNDPILDLFARWRGSEVIIIPVAAAGNRAKDFPDALALSPEVISVTGDIREEGPRNLCNLDNPDGPDEIVTYYPNAGEVRRPDNYQTPSGHELWGTSFATPEMSYLAALYLLRLGDRPLCDDPWPPLAYAYPTPLVPTDPTPTPSWDNLALDKAIDFCKEFPTLQ